MKRKTIRLVGMLVMIATALILTTGEVRAEPITTTEVYTYYFPIIMRNSVPGIKSMLYVKTREFPEQRHNSTALNIVADNGKIYLPVFVWYEWVYAPDSQSPNNPTASGTSSLGGLQIYSTLQPYQSQGPPTLTLLYNNVDLRRYPKRIDDIGVYEVAPYGDYLFVTRGVGIWPIEVGHEGVDVLDRYNLRKLTEFETPTRDYEIHNGYAYSIDGYIYVYDISDPFEPEHIRTTRKGYNNFLIDDRWIYASDWWEGLSILTPVTLEPVAGIENAEIGLAVQDGLLYAYNDGRLVIYDVTNVEDVRLVGETAIPLGVSVYIYGPSPLPVEGMLRGDYLYVPAQQYGVRIIDVSDPTNPYQVAYYDTIGKAKGITESGGYAYIATLKGIEVFPLYGASAR
jgi:hypothetical protein